MKAAVLREVNKPLSIEEVSHGKPGPREVLVRTVAAGVCHSDLHFQNGAYPYPLPSVLGHESAGVVEAVGSDVTYVKPGDHVITWSLRILPDRAHVVVRRTRTAARR
jgi:S-(hydroxymethyl)glutathione dehydrogenase/alcohol dehydrogenase